MYNVESIPIEERSHPVIGSTIILLCVILEVCYIPCIYAMCQKNQRQQHGYKLMIYLGLVEVTGILVSSQAGWWFIEGAAFCSHPLSIYFNCILGVGLWVMESTILLSLALNRCLVVYDSHLTDRLFGGSRMIIWMLVPFLTAIIIVSYSPPIIINAQSTGLFHNPHLHYLPDNDYVCNYIRFFEKS
ncbi:serpentine type 7TM GPCR chemoreceptor srt domain-containing protein [Ditylenchus destructor]|nr:serpentine type 7TM GPCR chemoreceptor srt domain-containing protein [Ditylenchus destructor]